MTTTPNLPPLPEPEGHLYDGPNGTIGFHRGGLNRWTDLIHSTTPVFSAAKVQEIQLTAYQAGAAIELAGHRFDGLDLIERVMRNMKGDSRYGRERWVMVMSTFAVGSTVAHAMCHEFGLDPDDILRK